MKGIPGLLMMAVIVAFTMATGCNKDDDKVTNKITIAGNTTADYNKTYTPVDGYYIGPYEVQCMTTTYGTQISINFTPTSSLYMEFILGSDMVSVPSGTLIPSAGECLDGFYAAFYPNTGKKNGGLHISSGTISFKKDGDNYDVDLNLTIHPEYGGGTLKGNFHGPIPEGDVK